MNGSEADAIRTHPAYAGRRGLVPELLRLVDQSQWANRLWIEHVHAHPDPDPRPRELLAHIVVGECIWFDRIAGAPRERDSFLPLAREELLRQLDENCETYLRLISERPAEVVHFRRASGEEYHATVGDIVLHLMTHGYHHRGQLAAYYAARSIAYPNTDHIQYLIANRL